MRNARYMKIFGIDDALFGTLASGAMGLFGASMQADSNADANRTNAYLASQAQQINREEAAANRAFSAHQAALAYGQSDYQADKARAFVDYQAKTARDYNTMMSNTAYQRQVDDMRAAGINPIMAAYKGGGAPAPNAPATAAPQADSKVASGVSTPGMIPAQMKPVIDHNVISSAMEMAKAFPSVKAAHADAKTKEELTRQAEAETSRIKSTDNLNKTTAKKVEEETREVKERIENERRKQSEVSVFGNRVNPAYYGDKLFDAYQYLKAKIPTHYHSAKELYGKFDRLYVSPSLDWIGRQ